MVVYSNQTEINNLELEVKIKKENLSKLQSFAYSLPEGERKDFYFWKIKSELEQVADLEQKISDLKRKLNFTKSH